jgi:hypothetical protein
LAETSQTDQLQAKKKWFQYLVLGLFLTTMGFAVITCVLMMMEQPWKKTVTCNQTDSSALSGNSEITKIVRAGQSGPQSCTVKINGGPSELLNWCINLMVLFGSLLIAIGVAALARHRYAKRGGNDG